jgi:hypothetical protein
VPLRLANLGAGEFSGRGPVYLSSTFGRRDVGARAADTVSSMTPPTWL